MEDTLRDLYHSRLDQQLRCLNPCFNGRYSQRVFDTCYLVIRLVLILVLMEDTLRGGRERE